MTCGCYGSVKPTPRHPLTCKLSVLILVAQLKFRMGFLKFLFIDHGISPVTVIANVVFTEEHFLIYTNLENVDEMTVCTYASVCMFCCSKVHHCSLLPI